MAGDLIHFESISGANNSVGTLFDPNFMNITNQKEVVTVGSLNFPGHLNATLSPFTNGQGVYTVIMPDETGTNFYLFVGVYPEGFNGEASIQCMDTINFILNFFHSSSYKYSGCQHRHS